MTDEQHAAALEQITHYPLTTRCLGVLRNAITTNDIPDASVATLRAQGPMFWLRRPNCGRMTMHEIERLVGGWPPPGERDD
jgi:hypothetical protein